MATSIAKHESRALVAGAVGRLGEALVSALLARGGYREVSVLASGAINPGVAGMTVFAADAVPAAHDLFIVLGSDSFSTRRSYHGRDACFEAMDEHNTLKVAKAAVAAGVKRIVLIAATPSWQQFGALHRGLGGSLEQELGALPLSRFVVLRPLRETESPGGSLMQRFVHAYLSIQMLMMPRSIPHLTSQQIAAAAVISAGMDEGQGVAVLSAADIASLLKPKASG